MKKQKMVKIVSVISVLLSVLVLAAVLFPHEASTGVLYRVSGGKQDLYLLGSIHVGSKDMYPFGSAIEKALKESEVLVFECDTQSSAGVEQTAQLMRYEDGTTLGEHVSEDCMEDVKSVAQKLGFDIRALEKLKPWAVTSLLSMDTLSAEMGTRDVHEAASLGVETVMHSYVGNKPVAYLETVQEQLLLMDSFSPQLQEHLLSSACRAILEPETAVDEELENWPLWWKEGNAQAFADSYLAGLAKEENPALAQEYHDALITERNCSMAQKIQTLLEGENSCFVTVGLMHLVLPEDSIIAELEAMGYQVDKIEN